MVVNRITTMGGRAGGGARSGGGGGARSSEASMTAESYVAKATKVLVDNMSKKGLSTYNRLVKLGYDKAIAATVVASPLTNNMSFKQIVSSLKTPSVTNSLSITQKQEMIHTSLLNWGLTGDVK